MFYLLGILLGGGSILALDMQHVPINSIKDVLEICLVIYLIDAAYLTADHRLKVGQGALTCFAFALGTHLTTTLATWAVLWSMRDPAEDTTMTKGAYYLLAVALDCLDHKRTVR